MPLAAKKKTKLAIISIKVTRSSATVSFERVYYLSMNDKYMKSPSLMVQQLLFYICRSRTTGHNPELQGLITRNVYMKYESSTFNGSKVMEKVQVFRKVGPRTQSR